MDHKPMDCKKITEEIIFLIGDNQMGQEIMVAYERHVSMCPECAHRARLAMRMLEQVRQKAMRRRAPKHLVLKIRARIQNQSSP